MDRFEEMKSFVCVVENGSISKAADRLNKAKSAISKRLSDLEGRLNVQLLNRTTRKLFLTESGQQYFSYCQRILADVEEAELSITNEHSQLKGTIRISAPLTFSIEHLSGLFNNFLQLHKDIKLDIDLTDKVVDIMQDEMDLAIRIAKLEDSSYKARRLAPINFVTCASPEYLQLHGEPKSIEQLQQHKSLNYSLAPEDFLWQFVSNNGELIKMNTEYRLRANNGNMLLNAAIDGLGIITSPTFITYKAISQGLLLPILENYHIPPMSVYAVYPSQQHLPLRIRKLIEYLAENLGEKPYWDNIS